jgi:hypothetical protein
MNEYTQIALGTKEATPFYTKMELGAGTVHCTVLFCEYIHIL